MSDRSVTNDRVSAQQGEQGRSKEHDQQRREHAEREREEHEDRKAARLGLGRAALGVAECVGLCDKKLRKRSTKSGRCTHQPADARLCRAGGCERRERARPPAPEREIREQPACLGQPRELRGATDKRPKSYWEDLQSSEYGFWANVNPEVAHPRWSQASEEVIGTGERRPTLLFNGYGEYVADLYKGLEAERLWV